MILSSLSRREKRLLYLTIIVLGVWISHKFIVNPLIVRWKELGEKIEERGLKLEKSRKILHLKEKIQGEYENYASSVKMQGSEEEEMAKFLTEIESIARSSSVHISDIKPRPVKNADFHERYLVELEAEGDISQISRFIYEIQSSPQLLKIDKYSIGTKGAGTNLLRCRVIVSKILLILK